MTLAKNRDRDFTLQNACCAPLLPSLALTNGHFHEEKVTNPTRSHSLHSLSPSFASTKRPTRRIEMGISHCRMLVVLRFLPRSHSQTDESGESLTLTQLALAFSLVRIHKTTHAKIQPPASASLSAASVRLRGRFVRMLTRRS